MEKSDEMTKARDSKGSNASDDNVIGMKRGSESATAAGLETIQDILFGEQVRAGNEQINKLQRESDENLRNLADSLNKRLDDLTESMNKKFDSLDNLLATQAQTQKESDQRLSADLLAAKSTLTQTIDATRDEMTQQLTAKVEIMDSKKLDQGKLSELFASVAGELAAAKT